MTAREFMGLAAVALAMFMVLCTVLAIVFGVHVDHRHNDNGTAIDATGNTYSNLGANSALGGE